MRAYARPLMVSDMGQPGQRCTPLEALPLRAGHGGLAYDEKWVQELIQAHPTLLPVEQIEPALTPLVPVCLELPTPSGFADNLFMTPDGGIVLVETKLWRNPEARREVVGQVLDYAKDLSRWSYEDLQRAVRAASRDRSGSIFQLVCGDGADASDEAPFIDAVTRNLRLGRFLLVIAGDGIQESAEHLADFLQRHVGLHFTLAMVELSLWRTAQGDVLVQPKILTRTVQIERAVVRMEEGVSLTPASIQPASAAASRPTTLSEETFYEALGEIDAGLPARLKAYLTELEPLGIYAEMKRTLLLKWRAPNGQAFTLASIYLDSQVSTDTAQSAAFSIGRTDIGTRYQEALAALLLGGSVKRTAKESWWRVVVADRSPPLATMLDHKAGWTAAMMAFISELTNALEERHEVA